MRDDSFPRTPEKNNVCVNNTENLECRELGKWQQSMLDLSATTTFCLAQTILMSSTVQIGPVLEQLFGMDTKTHNIIIIKL